MSDFRSRDVDLDLESVQEDGGPGHLLGTVQFIDRKGTAVSDFEYLRQLELGIGVERVEGYDRKRHEQLRTLRALPPESWWK